MLQDYEQLDDDDFELLEKQTLRVIVLALQEYSREAKLLFDTTQAPSDAEIVVLAEDIVQYALEVAECYPINRRFAGFIDYKRLRWFGTPAGVFPQALLVDAKASTENNRDTLQRSQLPMDADYLVRGTPTRMEKVLPDYMPIPIPGRENLKAVTTSVFVHFFYEDLGRKTPPFRNLKAMYVMALPHQRLKGIYNPNHNQTFFGAGKHSPKRKELPRIRVYFSRLREMCPWRLQELRYTAGSEHTLPVWKDTAANGTPGETTFNFVGR